MGDTSDCMLSTLLVWGALLMPLMMPVLGICLVIYFVVRLIECLSGDNTHDLSTLGLIMFFIITFCSLCCLCSSWVWWIVVCKVHGLKHHVVLELEVVNWMKLFMIIWVFSFGMMIPRCIVEMFRDEFEHKRDLVDLFDGGFLGGIECVVFILAELAVMKHAPKWKHHIALGLETWKLIQVLVLILFGIMIINVTTRLIVHVLQIAFGHRKHVVYFAKGLRKSTNFLFISTFLMTLWRCSFSIHFERTSVLSNKSLEFVTWSFVCVAIASVFWWFKKCIIVLWTAHAVYHRFHDKIMQAGIQLYFLRILGDKKAFHKEGGNVLMNFGKAYFNRQPTEENAGKNTQGNQQRKQKAKDILVQCKQSSLPTYDLQRMTEYFQGIDDSLLDQVKCYSSLFTVKKIPNLEKLLESTISNLLDTDEAGVLYEQIEKVDSTPGIDDLKYEKWVVKAYRNCSELGETLIGAEEVASYLNRLLTAFFLPLIVIIWLLVTKIATIKLFILVISPMLAATFIFGDFCKSIFQGVVFAFVIHLFDVGDVCVINGTQMEVKKIGIWKTTFVKVDTNEEVKYQNSVLADTVILKHKGGLDLNDSVEYSIAAASWNPSTFNKLKTHIHQYVEKSGECKTHPLGVLVKEVGENVKIVIHFKHEPGLQDMIHSECHKKQSRIRAELLLQVKNFLDWLANHN